MREEEARSLLRAVNDLHGAVGEAGIHARLRDWACTLTGASAASVTAEPEAGALAAALVDPSGRNRGWIQVSRGREGQFGPRDEIVLQGLAEAAAAALARSDAAPPSNPVPTWNELVGLSQRLARVGAWSADLERDRIYWTDEVAEIHEVPPTFVPSVEQALGFIAPEWREKIGGAFRRCAEEGAPYDLELELLTAKGRRVWVRTIGEAERDAGGRIVRINGAFQDISRLKAAEERFRAVLESITDAFFTLDRKWRFTYVNNEAVRLLRRSREELLGEQLWQAFPEAVGTAFESEYNAAQASGSKRSFTAAYPPLETWFRVTAYPSTEGLSVYFQDVTEQRQATEALRQSEARFRVLAKATADTLWDWNLLDDSFWWGEGGKALFGPDPPTSGARVSAWFERIHPDDRQRVLEGVRRALAAGDESWSDEYRFLRSDGSYGLMDNRGFAIRDEGGRILRMVGGMSDVTESRELEARLRQSQRLEAIGQLTGGVAHDFNNLLTVILGNAEALAQDLERQPRLGRLAEITRQAAERGAELTQRLLAFSRQQPLEPSVLDVPALIEAIRPLLQRAAGDSVEVELLRADSVTWEALADRAQLEAALLNLCLNARDAMPEGGRLTIEAANMRLDGLDMAAWNEGLTPGAYVLLAIRDTGTGMTPEVAARAFEPFFTTKGVGRGSGLGLSMVYGFARQSGGHVRIRSEPGAGSTVELYLPRAAAGDRRAGDERAGTESCGSGIEGELLRGGDERILLAEDDDLVREHVAAQLQAMGYRVVAVGDGHAALEAMRRQPDFDLLFTDVVMPGGLNGRQLAEAARRLRPDLRVLFTSGYAENAIVHDGRLDRGIHLLNKPYRRHDLAASLRQALDGDGRN